VSFKPNAAAASRLGSPVLRPIYLCLWVPNGIIVGCEALFVPYAGERAGWFFASGAAGMLLGDIMVGRFLSVDIRERLVGPLRILLAVPYLGFGLAPSVSLACLLVFVASVGFAASLPLQERLITHTDASQRGQVLGLNSTGLMVMQGVGALLGGTIAQLPGVPFAQTGRSHRQGVLINDLLLGPQLATPTPPGMAHCAYTALACGIDIPCRTVLAMAASWPTAPTGVLG